MNTAQLKYARERATAIHWRRAEKLTEEYNASKRASSDGRLDQLRYGEYRIRPEAHAGQKWSDRIEFNPLPTAIEQSVYDVAIAELKADLDKLVDSLVLGDAQEALALLRAFEAGERVA